MPILDACPNRFVGRVIWRADARRPRRVPARADRRRAGDRARTSSRSTAPSASTPGPRRLMETFTRLLPDRAAGLTAADLAAAVPGEAPDDRPFLLVNMIATADGRATIAGRTGADRQPRRLRAVPRAAHAGRRGHGRRRDRARRELRPDGAGGGARHAPARRAGRRSGCCGAPGNRVVVLTPSPDAELPPCRGAGALPARRRSRAACARLRTELGHPLGAVRGRPARARRRCCARGSSTSCTSSIAPKLAGGADPLTIVAGAALDPPADLRLLSLHESGGYLFLRYGA